MASYQVRMETLRQGSTVRDSITANNGQDVLTDRSGDVVRFTLRSDEQGTFEFLSNDRVNNEAKFKLYRDLDGDGRIDNNDPLDNAGNFNGDFGNPDLLIASDNGRIDLILAIDNGRGDEVGRDFNDMIVRIDLDPI